MALVNGSDYDHIDLHSAAGGDVTRHMLKDAQARQDVTDLKSAFSGLEDDLRTRRINFDLVGKYYLTNGETIDPSSPSVSSLYKCTVVDCVPGDTFTIHGNGSNTIRPYAFIDALNNVIAVANGQTVDALITAPTGSAKLVLNNRIANDYVSYYGVPLISNIDTMESDLSAAKSDINDLDVTVNEAKKVELEKVAGTGSRYYAYIPDNKKQYTVEGANTVWVALQGYDTPTFDGTKVYDSGTKTPPFVFDVSVLSNALYYRIVWGKDSNFTTEEIATFNAYFYKNLAELVDDIDTSVDTHLDLVKHGSATNRYYAYITDNNKDYVASADEAVWFALQGYETPDYAGTAAYDSGKKYVKNKFTIANKNLFYRICWGITGSFTDAQIATFDCYYVDTVVQAIDGINQKISGIDLFKTAVPGTGVLSIMHGGTTSYPSNTLGLYKAAYNSGIMMWECDVRPCLDGYVLCHDDDIYNHALDSNGDTIPQNTVKISESTVAQLKDYKFGIITNKQADGLVPGFENEKIPTLQEFLMFAKAYGANPVLEIKFSASQAQITDICNIIKQYGMLDCTYILGYQSASTVLTYALNNGIKNLAIIINDGDASASAIDTAFGIIESYTSQLQDVIFEPVYNNANLNEASVQYAASKGMRYGVWTIPANPQRNIVYDLFAIGVTAFTTNFSNINRIVHDFYN